MLGRIRHIIAGAALIFWPALMGPASAQQPPEPSPSGQMCVENRTPASVIVGEQPSLELRRFSVYLEPARFGPDGLDPVRGCEDHAKFNQLDSVRPASIVWLTASWSEITDGGVVSGVVTNPGMSYAPFCALDVQAGGVIVIRYDGALNANDTPVASKFICDRYNHDGTLRTEVLQPQPATWEGRPRCEERYPASDGWAKAFGHLTTGKCYRCPAGFARTIWGIDAGNACEKGGVLGIGSQHSKVQYAGPECGNPEPGRQNFRNGVLDQCYSCPEGWKNPPFGTISGNLTKVADACRPPGYPW